jgi:hypothetical protein
MRSTLDVENIVGAIVRYQNCVREEIKNRLNRGIIASVHFKIFCVLVSHVQT